jgi:hypothetical protein
MTDIIKYNDTDVDILIHGGPYTNEIKKTTINISFQLEIYRNSIINIICDIL